MVVAAAALPLPLPLLPPLPLALLLVPVRPFFFSFFFFAVSFFFFSFFFLVVAFGVVVVAFFLEFLAAFPSPLLSSYGDGKLTTDEVREQWEGFMAGVLTAAGEEDWTTVIELSYKLLHDPGPTEAQIRYNLAFALNAMDEYAKAKGELKASIRIARKAEDEKVAERSEYVLWAAPRVRRVLSHTTAIVVPKRRCHRQIALADVCSIAGCS